MKKALSIILAAVIALSVLSVAAAASDKDDLCFAIASPILYKFACDNDGVDDNNGVIEGYGTVNFKSNVSNIFENLNNLSEKITFYLQLVMSYLARLNAVFLK